MHGEKHKRVECGEEWVTHNTRNNKSGKVCKSCLEELPSEGDKGWRTLGNANVPNVRFMSLFLAFPEGYLHSRSLSCNLSLCPFVCATPPSVL